MSLFCDPPLPTSYEQVTEIFGGTGFIYLIDASECNQYIQDTTDSYQDLVDKGIQNIPGNYNYLHQ